MGDCEHSPSGKHCDHATGSGSSHGFGGADLMQCCYCGRYRTQKWVIRGVELQGHGKHFKQKLKVYE